MGGIRWSFPQSFRGKKETFLKKKEEVLKKEGKGPVAYETIRKGLHRKEMEEKFWQGGG